MLVGTWKSKLKLSLKIVSNAFFTVMIKPFDKPNSPKSLNFFELRKFSTISKVILFLCNTQMLTSITWKTSWELNVKNSNLSALQRGKMGTRSIVPQSTEEQS